MITLRFHNRRRIFGCAALLSAPLLCLKHYDGHINQSMAKETEKTAVRDIYMEDVRLELTNHETIAYDADNKPAVGHLCDQYMWLIEGYDEKAIAESSHASFDEKNRMLYVLGYGPGILGNSRSYCEERVCEWDDAAHTCRYVYYKSTGVPYDSGYYVAGRYMFEARNYQFTEDDRLLSLLSYSRQVGSDPYGYSDELFFFRGYQADYDGDWLMAELQYQDYWGTNEHGTWWHAVYQYNEQGDCTLAVITAEEEIILYRYEYDTIAGQTDAYTYTVNEDWELICDDGSTYYFRPQWGKPAVKKVAADGTVEQELYYGKAMDMGQQHYLMQEEVEAAMNDHIHVVKPGDCLWNIAYQYYGHGTDWKLLYRINRDIIGRDENLILPGMRLFIPEKGNEQDTKIH